MPCPWSAGDFALAVAGDFSDVGAGLTMVAMLLTRPVSVMGEVTMSVYQAMVNRYVLPIIEKHTVEDWVEGRAEEREEWLAWNRRRIDAEKQDRNSMNRPRRLTCRAPNAAPEYTPPTPEPSPAAQPSFCSQ